MINKLLCDDGIIPCRFITNICRSDGNAGKEEEGKMRAKEIRYIKTSEEKVVNELVTSVLTSPSCSLPGSAPADPRHVSVPDAEEDDDYVTTESDFSEEEQEDPSDYCRGCIIKLQ